MTDQRLPIPGQDDGTWGAILNAFLGVAHDADGNLLADAISAAGGVTTSQIGHANGVASLNASSVIPTVNLGSGTASNTTFLRGDGTWATPAGGGGAILDTTDSDIAPLGSQAAGNIGKAADAGHVHAMPRLDQVGAPTASVSANTQKITNLANGTLATDAAAFGQIPIAGMASGTYAAGDDSRITGALQSGATASGDLSGILPSPTVAKINGIAVTGTPDLGDYLIATGSTAASWQSAPSFSSTVDGGAP